MKSEESVAITLSQETRERDRGGIWVRKRKGAPFPALGVFINPKRRP